MISNVTKTSTNQHWTKQNKLSDGSKEIKSSNVSKDDEIKDFISYLQKEIEKSLDGDKIMICFKGATVAFNKNGYPYMTSHLCLKEECDAYDKGHCRLNALGFMIGKESDYVDKK